MIISEISCLPISRQLEERHLPSGQKSFMIDSYSSNLFTPKEDKQCCVHDVFGLVMGAALAAATMPTSHGLCGTGCDRA